MKQTTELFSSRHNGLSNEAVSHMYEALGVQSYEDLIEQTIPTSILNKNQIDLLPVAISEKQYANHIRELANKSTSIRNFIGQGYYGTYLPAVIQRNILENPGWYTAYTPYQAEISQGRLEALFNFQTVISELTALPLANASLLDEATAAAEAMAMLFDVKNKKSKKNLKKKLLVDQHVFNQTIHVLQTRAEQIGIEIELINWKMTEVDEDVFAAVIQYPDSRGDVHDYGHFVNKLNQNGAGIVVCADLLSLTLFTPPGEWGADVVVGNSQRFGVPMWFGGPHAGYFSCKEEYKRQLPGRIIGLSKDRFGEDAYRMALQTREQHIRRERATSNICTAQALLAIIAGTYALYHGPEGLKCIAEEINLKANFIKANLIKDGFDVLVTNTFDTISIRLDSAKLKSIKSRALELGMSFFYLDGEIRLSIDEMTSKADVLRILELFGIDESGQIETYNSYTGSCLRSSNYMEQPLFSSYRSETSLMRYLKHLENKDFSLVHGMIPLGSCTMKLNAAAQLLPLSWDAFTNVHPMSQGADIKAYEHVIKELGAYLCIITGFEACSFQPNSGAQGELTGLISIHKYHLAKGDEQRKVALIPASAHGTNPASAVMAGMKVVVVNTDELGNIDIQDLTSKAEAHSDELAALMITYPSTHGVYEKGVKQICQIIHEHGGLVYMDGANMNAQVGYTSPGIIGADVCHLNLHKTFAIPHGGGGPGMGPICVNEKLAPYLPKQNYFESGHVDGDYAISASQYGSPSILLISYAYIRMLGVNGLKLATCQAILSANYLCQRLKDHYPILYRGENGRVAHEFIVDLRPYKSFGIEAEDVAKRLMDFGFHAPTMSFPVPGTLMIEPTESEDLKELDRFCESMIIIRQEIEEVLEGKYEAGNNVLSNAPHTLKMITTDNWDHPYSRSKAAFPLGESSRINKFWPTVARIDNAYGDRNLICACPPIEAYVMES